MVPSADLSWNWHRGLAEEHASSPANAQSTIWTRNADHRSPYLFLFQFASLPKGARSAPAERHGIRQPPECCTNASNVMDDVTNTMNTDAAAEPQQPAVRVRVVDATTQKDHESKTEVVFVPCPDSEPIKIKNKALEQLRARRYVIKATAPATRSSTTSTARSTSTTTTSSWTRTAARRKKLL